MKLTDIIDRIKSRFPVWHHINYGVQTVQSFNKEALASAIVSLEIEGVRCSEIRKSLNSYYFFQIVNPNK